MFVASCVEEEDSEGPLRQIARGVGGYVGILLWQENVEGKVCGSICLAGHARQRGCTKMLDWNKGKFRS